MAQMKKGKWDEDSEELLDQIFGQAVTGDKKAIEFYAKAPAGLDVAMSEAFATNKKKLEEYEGLGVQVDWMKIEGPVGEFPPASYAKVFEGIPLRPRTVIEAISAGRKPPTIQEDRNEYAWQADPLTPFSEHPKEDS